jgi:3-dehydroquinate synthase
MSKDKKALSWKHIPLILASIFLFLFIIFEASGLITLEKINILVLESGSFAAAIIIIFLIIDLILPMPSTVLMTFSGAFYGVFIGTLINVTGSLLASLAGFAITRKLGKTRLFLDKTEKRSMDEWFIRWGEGILIISKMIPIVSETMACFVGLTRISWRKFIILSLLGIIPVSVYYAYVGSTSENFSEWLLPLFFGIAIPIAVWSILKKIQEKPLK